LTSISCVAIDLDGTLLNAAKQITLMTERIIRQCVGQGVHIVLATTRNPDATIPYCRQLGLNSPMICSNGSQVWATPDGPLWAYHTIPHDVALEIARFGDRHGFEIATTIESTTYFRQRSSQELEPLQRNIILVANNESGVVKAPVRMFAFDSEAIEAIEVFCNAHYADECRTQRFHLPGTDTIASLGIFPIGTDKGTALDIVMQKLNIAPANVMAIGDDLNDLPMLKRAGIAIAMGNAHAHLRAVATDSAPDYEHDGVGWALDTYVLNQTY
jgi:Cof subfamily protein (haloacid dehalogenase superfamily)